MNKLCVFASGTGTNFDAIYQATKDKSLDAQIVLVICDKPEALVISKAKAVGIEVFSFNPKHYSSKAEYEKEIVALLNKHGIDLVVLAGYMRLCGEVLLDSYEGRIINIHPSLLPAFSGKDAIGQAIAHGVKVMGVTIHYVDSGMDSGKIIDQAAFKVEENMSKEEIEHNIHKIEHQLYPKVIARLLENKEK